MNSNPTNHRSKGIHDKHTTRLSFSFLPSLLLILLLLSLTLFPSNASASPSLLRIPSRPPSQDNPDLIQPEKLTLSHSGIYVNLPSSPLQPPHSTHSQSQSLLSLYLDTDHYDPLSVKLEISSIKQRNWEDITYRCGIGGIENCRQLDLNQAAATATATATPHLNSNCQPVSDSIPGRLDFHLQDCLANFDPSLYLVDTTSASTSTADAAQSSITTLTSTVLKVTVQPSISNHDDSETETHSFWLAHLVNPNDDQRALWPLQGTAHHHPTQSILSMDQKQLELDNRRIWLQLGKQPNRIAGLMENPYLPKAAVVKDDDPDRGIDMRAAFWKLGISIRAPVGDSSTSSTSSIPSIFLSLKEEIRSLKARLESEEKEEAEALENFDERRKANQRSMEKRSQKVFSNSDSISNSIYSTSQESPSDQVTLSSLLPNSNGTFGYSAILSPTGGQVVYIGPYEIPIAPISGPGKSLNNEKGIVIQIRDEFGFVFQIFGISPLRIAVEEGERIEKGQFLGGISKRPLSDTPISRRKPADIPKNVRDSPRKAKYYPFRFRELRLNVARPDPQWEEWKEPFQKGWQYFNPLNFLSKGRDEKGGPSSKRSNIPPYGNPNAIYFSRPPGSKEEAISTSFTPNAFATSKDFLTPVLNGNVELITGFESFFETPDDPGDALDGLAVNRMDWGLVRKSDAEELLTRERERESESESESDGHDDDDEGKLMDQSCNVGQDEKVDWRLAFEHHKFPLDSILSSSAKPSWNLNSSSSSDPNPTLQSTSSSESRLSQPSNLLLRSYFLPAFSTGLIFKSYQTSQFDEKSRNLLYSPTRNLRGSPALGPEASWNTRDTQDGDYDLLIRATDWWGNQGCVRSRIKIRNL